MQKYHASFRSAASLQLFTVLILIFSVFIDTVYLMSSVAEVEPLTQQDNYYLLDKLPQPRPLQSPWWASQQLEVERDLHLSSSSPRNSRLFPYFLIQFPNDACSNAGGSQHGVCVSAKDCRVAKGDVIGTCAQGFGACCRYVKSCGVEGGDIQVKENSTEIRSANGSTSCRFILPKARGICQVRLDFVQFQWGKATDFGDCNETKIEIMGGTTIFSSLCGNLTGQHCMYVYINYGNVEKIYIYSDESASPNDTYSIRVSYIRCNSQQLVPSHCSQYYTGKSGQVRSFNWPFQQLNNQDYTICIEDPQTKHRKGKRLSHRQPLQQIQWSTCKSTYYNGTRDFFISGKISSAQRILDPSHCDTTDFIQIFGGNKQCGHVFQAETVISPPYLLRVRFDEVERTKAGMLASQGQQQNSVAVNKPGNNDCDILSTEETKCLQISSSLCNCTRALRRPNSKIENEVHDDEKNSGFCLSYKIVETL